MSAVPPSQTTDQQSAAGSPSASDAAAVNQKLVDQYTEIAKLAGGLAHEIKNPLSTIRLNMELLAEDFGEAENPRERRALAKISTVQRECQRLQDLLDDFLNFAKPRRLQLQPTNLNQEVERVLDFFRPQAADSGIELVRYLDLDLPPVQLDRETFHAALLNLVLNAQQAMPQGGQLVARTQVQGDHARLDLSTTEAESTQVLPQIFDAFFSTKRVARAWACRPCEKSSSAGDRSAYERGGQRRSSPSNCRWPAKRYLHSLRRPSGAAGLPCGFFAQLRAIPFKPGNEPSPPARSAPREAFESPLRSRWVGSWRVLQRDVRNSKTRLGWWTSL